MNLGSPKKDGIIPPGTKKSTERTSSRQFAKGQLQAARSQLMVYARDLKQMLEKEGQKTQQLKKAHAQMLAYARDLKLALDAEQQKNSELEQAYTDTILRLARASRYKDEETGAHIERLAITRKRLPWPLAGISHVLDVYSQ